MKKLIFALAIALSVNFGFMAASVYAANETIDSFTTDITITRDGTAQVTETIVYNFDSASRHGIYRDIPIDYKDGENNYYLTAKIQGITQDGRSAEYDTFRENGNERIKIGDPDATLTGIHTYVIRYTLTPVVYLLDGRQFLNLDVYGSGWNVPAQKVAATIRLEGGAALSDARWYGVGKAESSTNAAIFTDVPSYTPITFNAFLPDNYAANTLIANKERPGDFWSRIAMIIALLLGVIVFVGSLAIALYRWLYVKKKRGAQTVIPEYEPPKDMLPAGIGQLQDDVSDAKEFAATLIDWAVRGGLKINRIEKKTFGIKSVDYELIKQADISDLADGERALFNAIFAKATTVKVSSLSLFTEIESFRSFIKNRLTEKGYYQKGGGLLSRGLITDTGAKQWAKVEGFKMYLSVAEKDRIAFTDAPEKTPERFSALLPYAVAFGVEKEWAKQFEGVDIAQNTAWYGAGAFSAASLASDLSSGLTTAVASNSSFSSSGGSAGGGVGGGGGGSW